MPVLFVHLITTRGAPFFWIDFPLGEQVASVFHPKHVSDGSVTKGRRGSVDHEDNSAIQLLREINSSLKELVVLTRIQANEHVQQLLRSEFYNKEGPIQDRIRVYQHLHEGLSQQETADQVDGVSQSTVSRWLQHWRKIGLADDSGVLFDLSDFLPNLER